MRHQQNDGGGDAQTPIRPPIAAPMNWSRAVLSVAWNSVCTTEIAVIAAQKPSFSPSG